MSIDAFVSTGQGILGSNMFAYCLNAPVRLVDSSGYRAVLASHAATPSAQQRSLPKTGDPNSSQTLPNPDGTPKQKRWYDKDGNAKRDRDYNHQGDEDFPHDHEWKDGKRGKEHLPPSPDFEITGSLAKGTALAFASMAGIAYLLANDASGVGIADDAAIIPLFDVLHEAIKMIFK